MTVSEPDGEPDLVVPRRVEPLPGRTVALVATVVGLLTGIALVALLWWVGTSGLTGNDLTTARLDAIRVGLSIAVGGGGVFALFLAWRRQRSTEADHLQRERTMTHQRQVAQDNRDDAVERRIADLYTKSAELLGSDKSPVRLAGIYTLERLGQNSAELRQTIVNLYCAYLRTPIAVDPEEQHVRTTIQRVLTNHLAEPARDTFWSGLEIDLTGTILVDFDFSGCSVRHATFDRTEFRGDANFTRARFADSVSFRRARFVDEVSFTGAGLSRAEFDEVQFVKSASFASIQSADHVSFDRARFAGLASFVGARFRAVDFTRTEFDGPMICRAAGFAGSAVFTGARFADGAVFDDSTFHALASLAKLDFADSAVFTEVVFHQGATFRDSVFRGDALFGGSVFHQRSDFSGARFGRWANFAKVEFAQGVDVHPAYARLDVPEVQRAWPPDWELLEPRDDGTPAGLEGTWGRVVDRTKFGGGGKSG